MNLDFKHRALNALIISLIMSGSFSYIAFNTYLHIESITFIEVWMRAWYFAFPTLLIIVPFVTKVSIKILRIDYKKRV